MRLFKLQISKRSWQKILLFCFSVVFALLLGETALQFALDSIHNNGYYFMPPRHKAVFKPQPNIMPGISGDSYFYTNSNGVRGDEFTPQDTYRIMAIGGSTTECSYLDQPETWTNLLQETLNRNTRNQKVWVGNAGLSGTTTRHHLVAMQYLPLREMKINAVILLIGINDLSVRLSRDKDYDPNYLEKPEVKKELLYRTFSGTYNLYPEDPFYKRTALWQMLRQAKQMRSMEHIEDEGGRIYITWREHRRGASEMRDSLPDLSSALEEYAKNINMIIDLAREKSVRLILMTQPTMWRAGLPQDLDALLWLGGIGDFQKESGKPYYSVAALEKAMKAYNDTLLRVCRERSLECLDLASLLEKDTTVFYDDAHFNESGARKVAEALSKFMPVR
jgi:lysophospholipase L1-like esterase